MISIRLVGKDRKIVGIVDDNTPVPHTLARITNESTNYGLADEARQMYPELVQANKGDWPGAVFNMDKKPKHGRDFGKAGKEKETDEAIIVNIGDYEESIASDDEETELPKTTAVFNAQAAALASTSASAKKVANGVAGGGVGAKTNGYCMFIKHIARQKNATGCISALMAKFDKDWKMLPDDEKAEWKIRAKAGDRGKPADSQEGRGHGLPGRSSSPVACAPVLPRGRGRGRGRGTPAPVKVDYVEQDDDDEFF